MERGKGRAKERGKTEDGKVEKRMYTPFIFYPANL
jgi:hypothetical protein